MVIRGRERTLMRGKKRCGEVAWMVKENQCASDTKQRERNKRRWERGREIGGRGG